MATDIRAVPQERESAQQLFFREAMRHPLHSLSIVHEEVKIKVRIEAEEKKQAAYKLSKRATLIHLKSHSYTINATVEQLDQLLHKIQVAANHAQYSLPLVKRIHEALTRDVSSYNYKPSHDYPDFEKSRWHYYIVLSELYRYSTDGRKKSDAGIKFANQLWNLFSNVFGVDA